MGDAHLVGHLLLGHATSPADLGEAVADHLGEELALARVDGSRSSLLHLSSFLEVALVAFLGKRNRVSVCRRRQGRLSRVIDRA